MKVKKTKLKEFFIIENQIHKDERGCFIEIYHKKNLKNFGITTNFVQDNFSLSSKGVLRMHFQKNFPQGKLIRVLKGKVFDVVVDLRKILKLWIIFLYRIMMKISCNYGYQKVLLYFLTLSDKAYFEYKCTVFIKKMMKILFIGKIQI